MTARRLTRPRSLIATRYANKPPSHVRQDPMPPPIPSPQLSRCHRQAIVVIGLVTCRSIAPSITPQVGLQNPPPLSLQCTPLSVPGLPHSGKAVPRKNPWLNGTPRRGNFQRDFGQTTSSDREWKLLWNLATNSYGLQ